MIKKDLIFETQKLMVTDFFDLWGASSISAKTAKLTRPLKKEQKNLSITNWYYILYKKYQNISDLSLNLEGSADHYLLRDI